MKDLTPQQIVHELDKYIIGQNRAKRAVAVALRNRYRRSLLPAELQAEITPKNILMIGPTGVGKTEIARRLAKLADAPFIKVEATKFTEVGYVGRDVESIIRDLMETAVNMIHEEKVTEVRAKAEGLAVERILNYLCKAPSRVAANGALLQPDPALGKRDTISSVSTASTASTVKPAKVRRESAKSKVQRQKLAELLAAKELEEQIIEIELESEDGYPSVLELVTGINAEEVDNLQEFVTALPNNKKRSRQVSVKEARRLLTQEEANKLIDFDNLVEQATNRVEQSGVIFLDELDKIANSKVETGGPDVSGEGVQRDLLPIVEGAVVMSRYGPVKTDHVLWIAAGAFYASKPADLIPELQGRFPLRVEMSNLTQEDFKRILVEPENALTWQYKALLQTEEVRLEFTSDGIEEIASNACLMNERMENIGARRLHTIMEKVLEDVSFQASEMKGQQVFVDRAYIQLRLAEFIKNEDLSKYIL